MPTRNVVEAWCPGILIDAEPFVRTELSVFTFGMAHKVHPEFYHKLDKLLKNTGKSYCLYLSTALHEGTSIEIAFDAAVKNIRETFSGPVYFLGFLSDAAVLHYLTPGVTIAQMAYVTDPDGIDVEIIDQSPAVPARDGNPAQPAVPPGINHVGMIVLDSDRARSFYGALFGGVWQATEAPWMQGDFFDSAVGGHGNILRFFNLAFPEAYAPASRLNLELVEFQNRKKPLLHRNITDIGATYFGFEVKNLDAFLERALALGAQTIAGKSIVTERSGTREIMLRDWDTGAFVLLFEAAR